MSHQFDYEIYGELKGFHNQTNENDLADEMDYFYSRKLVTGAENLTF